MTRYRTIVADPPWQTTLVSATKLDASKVYQTLTVADICSLPVSGLAESDAHLWLWGINCMMEEAHQVVRAWGFRPITMITWCKPGPGVGHYLRNNTEHCILAGRGHPQTPDFKPLSTWYIWPRRHHSAKPEAFIDLVEQVSPDPYLELFARRHRLGWDVWGNEVTSTVEMPITGEEAS